MSWGFFKSHKHSFQRDKVGILELRHSNSDSVETGNVLIHDAHVNIGSYEYVSSFIVANCRYDFLLGSPWHWKEQPTTQYREGVLNVGGCILTSKKGKHDSCCISSISVKKFRRLLHKGNASFFQIFIHNASALGMGASHRRGAPDPRMKALL